jgi:hypothetical protein
MNTLFVILLVLLIKKIIDFIRYAANGNNNAVLTQALAWVIGVIAVYMAIWANLAGFADESGPRILWGVGFASAASSVHDFFKCIAKIWNKNSLLPPHAQPTV